MVVIMVVVVSDGSEGRVSDRPVCVTLGQPQVCVCVCVCMPWGRGSLPTLHHAHSHAATGFLRGCVAAGCCAAAPDDMCP